MALIAKIAETLRFLRYGPTRARSLEARLDETMRRIDLQAASLEQRACALEQRNAELHEYLRGVHDEVRGLRGQLSDLQAYTDNHLADVRGQVSPLQQAVRAGAADFQRESAWTRNQLNGLSAALDRAAAGGSAAAIPPSAAAAEETFYPTLEQYFRGSAQDVRDRLVNYREWIDGLPPGPVADLGCGRGEWLELLGDWGVAAQGVDLNALNVRALRERGLDVVHADAMQWLAAQPDDSFAALTAFHVIEHLPFGVLLRLVQQARRVLRPGGRLILETPNPENVIVATQTFWLDPSHVRPLPPALLEVIVRDAGLEPEALLRLNPPAEDGHDIADPTLRALMTQGRDCAVVARKSAVAAA